MDLADIISALKGASPALLVVGSVLILTKMILDHLRKMKAQSEMAALAEAVQDLTVKISTHTEQDTTMLTTISATQTEIKTTNQQLASALDQLVKLQLAANAQQSGKFINAENTRQIVLYQWNWCRDETTRILSTSIDRNHIQDREQVVANQVFRAWRKAAAEAKDSLDQLSGLSADYHGLFTSKTLCAVWDAAWRRAMPIYFKDFPAGSGTVDDHRTELTAMIYSLFDQAYDEFIACSYEMHERSDRPDRPISSANIPANADDLRLAEYMVTSMREYRPGSNTHKTVTTDQGGQDERVVRKQVGQSVRSARAGTGDHH